MTSRNPDLIHMHDLVHIRDRPHTYKVVGVRRNPYGGEYRLLGGAIWYRRDDLTPAHDPDREAVTS